MCSKLFATTDCVNYVKPKARDHRDRSDDDAQGADRHQQERRVAEVLDDELQLLEVSGGRRPVGV